MKYNPEEPKVNGKPSGGMTRRHFLKLLGAGIAATSIGNLAKIVLADKEKKQVKSLENWDSALSFLQSSHWEDREGETGEKQRIWKGFGKKAIWKEVREVPLGEKRTLLIKRRPKFEKAKKKVEYTFENLHLRGKVTKNVVTDTIGLYERALRYKNLTDLVEAKYNLPKNFLLAMLVHESQGGAIPVNWKDGGAGVIHTQPAVGIEFHIQVYENLNEISDRNHANKLLKLFKEKRGDPFELSKYDERFHPLINIDLAARKILLHMHKSEVKDGYLRRGARDFSAREEYWEYIKKRAKHLEDEKFLKKVEEAFNRDNSELRINGKKPENPFLAYLQAFAEMNWENYGVDYYIQENPTAYTSKRLQASYRTYKNFLKK